MVSNPPSVIEKVFLKKPDELKHVDNEKKTFLIYLSLLLDVSKSSLCSIDISSKCY